MQLPPLVSLLHVVMAGAACAAGTPWRNAAGQQCIHCDMIMTAPQARQPGLPATCGQPAGLCPEHLQQVSSTTDPPAHLHSCEGVQADGVHLEPKVGQLCLKAAGHALYG